MVEVDWVQLRDTDEVTRSDLIWFIDDIKNDVLFEYEKITGETPEWDDPTFQMWADNTEFDWDWQRALVEAVKFAEALGDSTAYSEGRAGEICECEVQAIVDESNLPSWVVVNVWETARNLLDEYTTFEFLDDTYYWR